MSWSKMYSYLTLYPFPKPKITHSFYILSHKVVNYIESRMREIFKYGSMRGIMHLLNIKLYGKEE